MLLYMVNVNIKLINSPQSTALNGTDVGMKAPFSPSPLPGWQPAGPTGAAAGPILVYPSRKVSA